MKQEINEMAITQQIKPQFLGSVLAEKELEDGIE